MDGAVPVVVVEVAASVVKAHSHDQYNGGMGGGCNDGNNGDDEQDDNKQSRASRSDGDVEVAVDEVNQEGVEVSADEAAPELLQKFRLTGKEI